MRKRRALAIGLAAGLVIYLAPGAYAFWGPAKRLTWTSGFSQCPSIAADSSGVIHIVWQDDPPIGAPEIYYKRSTDGGSTWSAAHRAASFNRSGRPESLLINFPAGQPA